MEVVDIEVGSWDRFSTWKRRRRLGDVVCTAVSTVFFSRYFGFQDSGERSLFVFCCQEFFFVAVVEVCCSDCLLCMLLLKWGVDQEHRIEYITIENSLIMNIGPAWKCMEQSCSNHFAGS